MTTGLDTEVILTDVQRAVSDFTEKSGIRVSLQAEELIASILGAFLFDPHPSWHADRRDHSALFKAHLSSLPKYLADIAKRSGERKQITSFDVLAWLGENLKSICDYACPF